MTSHSLVLYNGYIGQNMPHTQYERLILMSLSSLALLLIVAAPTVVLLFTVLLEERRLLNAKAIHQRDALADEMRRALEAPRRNTN